MSNRSVIVYFPVICLFNSTPPITLFIFWSYPLSHLLIPPLFSINSSSGASDLSYLDFDRFVLWWCLDYLEDKEGEPWFSSVPSWDSQLVDSFQSTSQILGLLEWFKDTLNFCHCQSLLLRRFCNQIIFSPWYVVRPFSYFSANCLWGEVHHLMKGVCGKPAGERGWAQTKRIL